ncbi:MAG: formimidoylglutamate deiminase [Pseudomonadota bacterium]
MPFTAPRQTSEITAAHALLPEGWARDVRLTLEDGWIADVEADVAGLNAPDVLLLPGMVNAHARSPARAMAGLAQGFSGAEGDVDWRRRLSDLLLRATPAQIGDIVRYAHVEMLEAGFTGIVEALGLHNAPSGTPYDNPGEIGGHVIRASEEAGTILTLLPQGRSVGGPDGAAPEAYERRSVTPPARFLRIVRRLTDIAAEREARIGFALAAPWAMPPEAVRDALAEFAGPVQIVASERAREALAHLSWIKARALAWLCETYPVDTRWSLVGANHLIDDEIQRWAHTGAVAVACPTQGLETGAGIFPATRFVAAKGRLAIGSAEASRTGPAEELRMLELGQRVRDRVRGGAVRVPEIGRALFERSLRAGVQVSGHRTGRIDIGYRADLLTLDASDDALALREGDGWLDGWIFAAGRRAVRDVWVGGRQRVEAGRHVDREPARQAYLASARALMNAV